MRKLATVRKIIDITSIPGADTIECAQVDGWKVVVKKSEFEVGQLALYIEVDAFVPTELASFLSKGKEPREYNGIKGERLRTVKLRQQISQGLLLPLKGEYEEGQDLSDELGIQKYEAPIPAQLAGTVKGNFPSFIPKTDQERIQNLSRELAQWASEDKEWEVTEKLDGSSMTVYLYQGEFGVCSRNLDLKEDENNSFWKAARANKLEEKLRAVGRNLALQGELIGEGIQKNQYALQGQEFYLFDIYDIDAGGYMPARKRVDLLTELNVRHCPILWCDRLKNKTCEDILWLAEGESFLNNSAKREGIVFKCGDDSFKAISNTFLLGEK